MEEFMKKYNLLVDHQDVALEVHEGDLVDLDNHGTSCNRLVWKN